VDVDIDRFLKTSRFINGIFLHCAARSRSLQRARKQQREKSSKTLVNTKLVIFGGGTQVSLTDQGQTAGADHKNCGLGDAASSASLSPNAVPALP